MHRCCPMCPGVPHSMKVFPTMHSCSPLCTGVFTGVPHGTVCSDSPIVCSILHCAWMFHTVCRCSHYPQVFPTVHGCYPLCEGIPHCAQLLHIVYLCSPLCAGVSHCAQVFPLCTDVPYCARLFPAVSTVGHASAHLVTTMHSGNTHAQ